MHPDLTQRGVTFVVQRAVGQVERPQEPPDLTVVPVEDGVDPHERRHPVAGTATQTNVARFPCLVSGAPKQATFMVRKYHVSCGGRGWEWLKLAGEYTMGDG